MVLTNLKNLAKRRGISSLGVASSGTKSFFVFLATRDITLLYFVTIASVDAFVFLFSVFLRKVAMSSSSSSSLISVKSSLDHTNSSSTLSLSVISTASPTFSSPPMFSFCWSSIPSAKKIGSSSSQSMPMSSNFPSCWSRPGDEYISGEAPKLKSAVSLFSSISDFVGE